MSFIQKNNRNNGIEMPKKASTAFAIGQAVQIDGTTGFIDLADGSTPILGICNVDVLASDATNDPISLSEASYVDEFRIPADAATEAMVGRYLALNATSDGVVVAGIATAAAVDTPILMTKFVSATEIIGKIAFKA